MALLYLREWLTFLCRIYDGIGASDRVLRLGRIVSGAEDSMLRLCFALELSLMIFPSTGLQ